MLCLSPLHIAGCCGLASPGGSPFSWATHLADRSQGHPGTQRECVSQGLRGSRLYVEDVCEEGMWKPCGVGWGCFQVPAGAPT